MAYIIPGVGGTTTANGQSTDSLQQSAPLLNKYSPRLFGSPPQLTSLNDMRLMSSNGETEGPVGDFYLRHILRDAQVVNFVVGKAMFTGGMSTFANAIRVCAQYAHALNKFGVSNTAVNGVNSAQSAAESEEWVQAYKEALVTDTGKYETHKASEVAGINVEDLGEDTTVLSSAEISTYINDTFGTWFGGITTPLLTSLSVQQPFYTFESDWNSYINNVKMMINAAIIMLGLQDSYVRIGEELFPILPTLHMESDGSNDVWANYRYVTPSKGVGAALELDSQNGDTSQYVSFMTDPKSVTETYTNSVGDSLIYSSVLSMGNDYGSEIAFLTSSSQNAVDDALVNLAGDVITVAEGVMSKLGSVGRFTAGIASSMFRSFKGDHTIYPQIFKSHTSNSSAFSFTVKLRASGGDPYSYLTEVLVPMFFALGLVLPQMSRNSAAAYSYPPLVQCNVPGIWGTRLGIVNELSVTKNSDGNDVSVYGYPLSVDMTISVTDLQHTLMTSPMNRTSLMLNNHPMFDYIAQCCGVDKYRVNGSMRIVTKALLGAANMENIRYNWGQALQSDFYDWANRFLGTARM